MSATCCSASPTGYPRAARTVLTSVSAWLTALEGSSTKRRWTAAQSSVYRSRSEGGGDGGGNSRLAFRGRSGPLPRALAGDEDGDDDDERRHDDDDRYQYFGVHLLLTSGR